MRSGLGGAAIALAIVLSACSKGGGGQAAQGNTADLATAPPATAEAQPAGIALDEPANVGPAQIRVLSVQTRSVVGTEATAQRAAEGRVLVAVRYEVKNSSTAPLPFFKQPGLTLLDPGGAATSPDMAKSGAFASEQDAGRNILDAIAPGAAVQTARVFEVPSAAFELARWRLRAGDQDGPLLSMVAVAKPAEAGPPPPPPSAPLPAEQAAAPPAPAAGAAPVPAAGGQAVPPAQARPSPASYAARDRRLAALITNADARDVTGEASRDAGVRRAQRARCATAQCIEASYAAQEAKLRQWDGADDIFRQYRVPAGR